MTTPFFSKSLLAGLACSTIAVATSTVWAQTEQTSPLDEIVFTAKANQSLKDVLAISHILTAADIEAAQVLDIPDLLDYVSGISITESGGRGSVTGVFVRGSASTQTIVLIDGVRVGSATLGSAALNSYPIEAIERIEVVKGPLSGIYGADAVGGVIQLFTKKGGDSGSSASATAGSDSLQQASIGLSGGNDKHSFHLSASTEETDGIDHTSIVTGGNADLDGFEEKSFSLGAQTTLSDNTTAKLSVLYSDSTAEFDNTFGSDPGLMSDTQTLSAAVNVTSQLSDSLEWVTTVGINEDEIVTNGDFPSEFTTNRDSLGTELALNLSETSHLTVGVDYYQEDIASSNNFPITDRDNTGAYALVRSSLGKLGVLASLRYDDNSAYGSDTNGSVAIDARLSDNIRATLSYGTAFAAPSFNFLYFPFFGNPDLLPEESESYELSLQGNNDSLNWRVSAYKKDVENLFSFDPATFLAANVGAAEFEGIEFELHTQVALWNLGVNLDLLSATDRDSGIELNDRAEQTLRLSAARSFGDFDLRINLKAENDRFDNNGTEVDSFTVLDLAASYKVNENLSISAKLDNAFDEDYFVNLIGPSNHYNTPGRKARLTARYQF